MRRGREILMVAAILGVLATYWIGSEIHYLRRISPKGITTVRDFFDRFGEPRRVRMLQREGKSYYEFTGQLPGSWSVAVPSAPPAYVFDEQGQFTTWCRDPGDAPNYRRSWRLQSTNHIEVRMIREKFGL